MKTYKINFKYSTNNGNTWTGTTISVKSETDTGAIEQVKSKYSLVKDIEILDVKS